jgi:hypothetical protein
MITSQRTGFEVQALETGPTQGFEISSGRFDGGSGVDKVDLASYKSTPFGRSASLLT